jgi:mono/diheme cytochrome c family protein
MKFMLRVVVAAALACTWFGVAEAEEAKIWVASAARGEKLAERFCASCHLVREGQTNGVAAGVPSFKAMTNLPDERVANVLMIPHMPMPNMQLTRNEIADIVAFVAELRRKVEGQPPAGAPNTRKKPVYPSPS